MNRKDLAESFEKFLAQNKDVPLGGREYLDRVLGVIDSAEKNNKEESKKLSPFNLILALDFAATYMFVMNKIKGVNPFELNQFFTNHLPQLAGEFGQQSLDYLNSGEYGKTWDDFETRKYGRPLRKGPPLRHNFV